MPASLSSVALRPGQAYLPEVEDPPPPESGFGPLSVAIAVSLVLHSFALLVTFQFPDRKAFDRGQTLEVVLVNAKSARKPINADALAQHNLDGGGNTELERRARSNLPVLPDMPSDADIAVAAKRVEQLEQEAQQLLTRLKAEIGRAHV